MTSRSFDPRTPEERLVAQTLRGLPQADLDAVSYERLMTLLRRLRLVELLGRRVEGAPGWFAERVEQVRSDGARQAALQELVLLRTLSVIERDGIRVAPVKGVTLAVEAHGDIAARPSLDVDLLLRSEDLRRAATLVAGMGWGAPNDALDAAGRPSLHLALAGPGELPDVELHWRMHWWETEFGPAALARAKAGSPGVRLQPADHLAVVLMAYARDGLTGLRHPADASAIVRAWPGAAPLDPGLLNGPLGPSLVAAATAVELAEGTPAAKLTGADAPITRRTRVALALANPFLRGEDQQISADLSLVDLVLAPVGGWSTAARRQLAPPLAELMRRRPEIATRGRPGLVAARAEHALRLLRRYGLAGGRITGVALDSSVLGRRARP